MKTFSNSRTSRRPLLALTTPRIPQSLLHNPGGETGTLISWNQTGLSKVILDSNASLENNYYPLSGNYCFVGGNGNGGSPSGVRQNVDLLAGLQNFTATELDLNPLRVNVSFHYQTRDNTFPLNSHDSPEVSLKFKNIGNTVISTMTASVPRCPTSPSTWCNYSAQSLLPVATRSIDYDMTFIRRGGSRILAYIDDNSLMIY